MRQLKITKSITNRESPSLEKYFQEIGKEELITAEQEVELAYRIKNGDPYALEKLIKSNLRFVVSVAKQYQNQGLSLPDLINEGNIGLVKAAERFDETRGFKFVSYAVWWIRQSILQAISEQSRIVRLPLNRVGTINKINKAISTFEQKEERKPTTGELSDVLEIPLINIRDMMSFSFGKHTSLDASFIEGEENNLLDVLENDNLPTDSVLVDESLTFEINRLMGQVLEIREEEIVRMFFGIGYQEMSLEEIGAIYGLTRERVRQIKEKAIRKMKHIKRNKVLKTYLG